MQSSSIPVTTPPAYTRSTPQIISRNSARGVTARSSIWRAVSVSRRRTNPLRPGGTVALPEQQPHRQDLEIPDRIHLGVRVILSLNSQLMPARTDDWPVALLCGDGEFHCCADRHWTHRRNQVLGLSYHDHSVPPTHAHLGVTYAHPLQVFTYFSSRAQSQPCLVI